MISTNITNTSYNGLTIKPWVLRIKATTKCPKTQALPPQHHVYEITFHTLVFIQMLTLHEMPQVVPT